MSDNTSQNRFDLEIVKRVQQGDKNAFDLLVIKYQHKLAKVVTSYVPDSDVLDVVQDTFIKAYKSLTLFKGDSSFYTWLYRIAVNTAKNYITAQNRRPPRMDVDAIEAEFHASGSVLHDHATPEANISKQQISDLISRVINNLPEELKVAITLREHKAMSYDEIAEIMECPVGTVRSRIFRAREAIEMELNKIL